MAFILSEENVILYLSFPRREQQRRKRFPVRRTCWVGVCFLCLLFFVIMCAGPCGGQIRAVDAPGTGVLGSREPPSVRTKLGV